VSTETKLRAAVDVLEGLQWIGDGIYCPQCGCLKDHGHNITCHLARVLLVNGRQVTWEKGACAATLTLSGYEK